MTGDRINDIRGALRRASMSDLNVASDETLRLLAADLDRWHRRVRDVQEWRRHERMVAACPLYRDRVDGCRIGTPVGEEVND